MIKLFDENFRYTNEGSNIESEVYAALHKVLHNHPGLSPREFVILVHFATTDVVVNAVLDHAVTKKNT